MAQGFNPHKDARDTMWTLFWMRENHSTKPDIEVDREVLKRNVAKLIRIATQKDAGQRGNKNYLNWEELDIVLMMIACCSTSLCLSGVFGDMPEIEE